MTEQRAGWYDDPNDPTMLRYWDGVIWTTNVAPKTSPTAAASTIGSPPQPTYPPQYAPQDSSAGVGAPSAGGYQAYPSAAPAWQQGVELGRPSATTPDGVALSGWWKRVLARIIDWVVVFVISLPLTFSSYATMGRIMGDYIGDAIDAAEAGSTTALPMPTELTGSMIRATLLTVLVYAVYEIGMVSWRGATLGKMVVGISVRLRDRPGPPPFGAAVLRWFVKDLGSILGIVPLLSFFGSIFSLLDSLWPLWDSKKQALHDKVAHTNVVVGKQPPAARPSGRPGA